MKIHIATLFDSNYVVRAAAFYDALKKLGDYDFWFLCLDNEARDVMNELGLAGVTVVTLGDMKDAELLATRPDRSQAEFVFTAKPAFLNYVARKLPDGDALIFADNDVIFFAKPDPVLEKMQRGSTCIGISPHRFPAEKEFMNERVGTYNAGLQFYILNADARSCISDWRKDCIDWCYLRYGEERFADQKYINKWPKRYHGVTELDKTMNLASWNIKNWKITETDGRFFVDGEPLVCYHFHRIRFYMDRGRAKPVPIHIFHTKLYRLYTEMVDVAWHKIENVKPGWRSGFVEKPNFLRLLKQKLQIKYARKID